MSAADEARGPHRALAWSAWGACSLIWGSTFLFISMGNDALPPVWAACLRLALATGLLALLARALRHPFPRGAALRTALAYGALQFGLNFALLYWSETTFPSGLTAVIYATIPLSTALMTRVHGLEGLAPLKVAGAGVALAGLALIFSGQTGQGVGVGTFAALLVAATLAAYSGVLLKLGPRQSPLWANAVGAAAGLGVCLAASFALREAHPLPLRFAAWFPVLYLTLAGSVGAFVLFAWLIGHWPVTRVSFIGVVNPVVALVLGAMVRHERIGPWSFAGSGLVILGVVVGVRASAPERAAARTPR